MDLVNFSVAQNRLVGVPVRLPLNLPGSRIAPFLKQQLSESRERNNHVVIRAPCRSAVEIARNERPDGDISLRGVTTSRYGDISVGFRPERYFSTEWPERL